MGATLNICSVDKKANFTSSITVQFLTSAFGAATSDESGEDSKAPVHGVWGNAAKEFFAPIEDSQCEGIPDKDLWQERLFSSSREGNFKKVVEALGNHAHINARTSRGQTPLMLAAASYGKTSLDTVRFLIETNSDLEAKDNNGWTPLLYACRNTQIEAANILIERGSSVKARSHDGMTACMLSAMDGGDRLVMDLVAKSAPIDKKDDRGWTLLFVACSDGRLELVKWLLKKGANVKDRSKENQTVMMVCVNSGNPKIADKLLKKQANLDSQTNDGDTALLIAIQKHQEEFAKWLVENGTDVSIRNTRGEDALILSEAWGMTMLRNLIEHRIRAVND